MNMIAKKQEISKWIMTNQKEIILIIGVVLISLLSFSAGYITAKQAEKEPLRFEYE